MYTGRFQNLKVGMTRYALMVDESGVIIDDGVVARLVGGALLLHDDDDRLGARVSRDAAAATRMWRPRRAASSTLTGAMAAMNLAGPRSRAVLASADAISRWTMPRFPTSVCAKAT